MALWLNYVKKSCLSFWHELLLHQRGASWSHVSGKLEGSQILEFLLQLCTIFEIFNIHSLPKITYNKYITNGYTLYKLYSDLLTTKIMYHQDTRFWYTPPESATVLEPVQDTGGFLGVSPPFRLFEHSLGNCECATIVHGDVLYNIVMEFSEEYSCYTPQLSIYLTLTKLGCCFDDFPPKSLHSTSLSDGAAKKIVPKNSIEKTE